MLNPTVGDISETSSPETFFITVVFPAQLHSQEQGKLNAEFQLITPHTMSFENINLHYLDQG